MSLPLLHKDLPAVDAELAENVIAVHPGLGDSSAVQNVGKLVQTDWVAVLRIGGDNQIPVLYTSP